jgi:hypothetical protein
MVYTKPEIRQNPVVQELAMEKEAPDQVSAGEISKEVALSMVPVYGTVREFQKGNIGWGIFGAITDALTLIPVIGAGAKAIGTAIRGGCAAVKALRVGLTTAEVTSKITTATVAKQFAAGASEGLVKSGKELGQAALRAMDPGIGLVYGGSSLIRRQTAKMASNISSTIVKSADALEDFGKWKKFPSSIPVLDTINILQDNFHKIKTTTKLSEQFLLDFNRATYKVDGKVIPRGDHIQFEKAIPDIKKRQLISSYANQASLADPSVGAMSFLPDSFAKHGAHNSNVSYEIWNTPDKKIKLIAKVESQLTPVDIADGEKIYSSYGLKAEMILSENTPSKYKYSYYLF